MYNAGVVTDNTVAHQAMWSKLKTVFPHRFFHGCASHGLTLFVQDIFAPELSQPHDQHSHNHHQSMRAKRFPDGYPFERLAQLTDSCRRIVALFSQDESLKTELSRLLREANVAMVHFPAPSGDWRSLRAAFLSLLSAHKMLQLVVSDRGFVTRGGPPSSTSNAPGAQPQENEKVRARVQQDVLSPDFAPLLEKAVTILQPLEEFMGVFDADAQSSSVPCSEVFYVFAKALPDALVRIAGLSKSERTYLLFLNQTRFNFLYGDAHGIAYLLDPRYIGDGLNADVRKNIEDIIFDLPTVSTSDADNGESNEDAKLEIAQQLTEFVIDATREKSSKSFRFTLLLRNRKTPLQFWLTDGRRWPLLQRVACKVFSLPSSTVAVQRRVASRASIPNDTSSTLPPAVASKLMYVRANSQRGHEASSLEEHDSQAADGEDRMRVELQADHALLGDI